MKTKLILALAIVLFSFTQAFSQEHNRGKLSELAVKGDTVTMSYFPVENFQQYMMSMVVQSKEIEIELSDKVEKRMFTVKDIKTINKIKTALSKENCFVGIDCTTMLLEMSAIRKGGIDMFVKSEVQLLN